MNRVRVLPVYAISGGWAEAVEHFLQHITLRREDPAGVPQPEPPMLFNEEEREP